MNKKHQKKLAMNTVTSLAYEVTAIVCGLILPRLILQTFGSEVNGLVNSITQFLTIISFLDLGVGAVIQSSLYKPLAEKDNLGISRIMASGQKFFRKIAMILLVYVVALMGVYPFIAEQDFGWVYTATLIAAMSISSFAQYYFGVVDRILLTADQRGYIQYTAQIVTLILNTALCALFIYLGFGIQIVKLTTSLIYLLRPLFLRWYVNRHYSIDRKIKYEGEPIKQKWNGMAQHVCAVVLDGTDTIVLTVFSTLSNVSIYSVYHLVVYNIKNLINSMTVGIRALLGELWAKKEEKEQELKRTYYWYEWVLHTIVVLIFGCAGMLILPFVKLYTAGITDVEYIVPVFAILIVLANAVHCLRIPYNGMILVAGHYKQTQHSYIIATVMNVVISIVTVFFWGLIGVAIGTLVSMAYQTIWMAIYNSKHLIKGAFKSFVKQIIVDLVTVALGILATYWIPMLGDSWLYWILLSVETVLVWIAIILVVNVIFYRDRLITFVQKVKGKFFHKKHTKTNGDTEE